jgi:hypothetical protein
LPGGLSAPQAAHTSVSGLPQSAQKRLPSGVWPPQFGHVITRPD